MFGAIRNSYRGITALYGWYLLAFPVGLVVGLSLALDDSSQDGAAALSTPLQIMAIVAGLIIAGAISVAGSVSRNPGRAENAQVEQAEGGNDNHERPMSVNKLLVLHSGSAILGISATVMHLVSLQYNIDWISRALGGLAFSTMSLVLLGTLRFLTKLDGLLTD